MINLTMSYNPTKDMNTTDFKRLDTDYYFNDVDKILKMDGRYSPFIFNNDYRKSENYQKNVSNVIVLDFDDGYTRSQFKSDFNFLCAIGTTKSHLKEKNGISCERFRVIIPTETAIDLNSEEYANLMRSIFKKYPHADQACKDTARAYTGFSSSEVEIIDGSLFDWEEYYNDHLQEIEIMKRWQEKERQNQSFEKEGEKIDWYRDNWLNDAMRKALKVDEKFVSGNRNNALYSYARFFKDEGFTDSEIRDAVEWINNFELDQFEIKQIFKGLRISI